MDPTLDPFAPANLDNPALARRVPLQVMSAWLGLSLPDEACTWADASFRLGAPDPPAEAAEQIGGFLAWGFGDGLVALTPGGFAESILAGGDNAALEGDAPTTAARSWCCTARRIATSTSSINPIGS